MTLKRSLFRIRYRTRFIVTEPDSGAPIVDVQIVKSRWLSQRAEAQRLLDRASRPWARIRTRLRSIGDAAQLLDAFYVTEIPVLLDKTVAGEPLVSAQTNRIATDYKALIDQASELLHNQLLPTIAEVIAPVLPVRTLADGQAAWLQAYYQQQVFPLLIPQAVDASRPFPNINNALLSLLVELKQPMVIGRESSPLFASITMPPSASRLIEVPPLDGAERTFVWLEDAVRHNIAQIFPGVDVLAVHPFRVLRGQRPDIAVDLEQPIHPPVTRLDVEDEMPDQVLNWLTRHLHEPSSIIIRGQPPLGLADLTSISRQLPGQSNWLLRQSTKLWTVFFGHI